MDEHGRLIEAGAHPRPPPRPADPLRDMRTKDLVTELARKASELARKEVELAKAEVRSDVRASAHMAAGLGAAGVCALLGIALLLVALVFALAEGDVMPGWAAALVVAAVVLAIGAGVGLWGWSRRVRKPLDVTRRSVKENVQWAKERIA